MTEKERETLARVDERTRHMSEDINSIKGMVDKLADSTKNEFVTKTEVEPIKRIVYGVVSIILTTVIGGLVALVVIKP